MAASGEPPPPPVAGVLPSTAAFRGFRPASPGQIPVSSVPQRPFGGVVWPRAAIVAAAAEAVETEKRWTMGSAGVVAAYNPESPWGAAGIAYDPTSPPWAWKASQPEAEMPAAREQANGASHDAAANEDDKPILPSGQVVFSESLQRILRSIPTTQPKLEFHGSASCLNAEEGQGVPRRFALADCPVNGGSSPKHSRKASATPSAATNGSKSAKKPSIGKTHPSPTAARAAVGRSVPAERMLRCCPVEVPSILHILLDGTGDKLGSRLIEQYSEHIDRLCPRHLEKYLALTASMPRQEGSAVQDHTPYSAPRHPTPQHHMPPPPRLATPRAALLPVAPASAIPSPSPAPSLTPTPTPTPLTQTTKRGCKKRGAGGEAGRGPRAPKAVRRNNVRPVVDVVRDHSYCQEFLREVRESFARRPEAEQTTHGGMTNRVVYNLLSVAQQPNMWAERGAVDVHCLTGEEARAVLDKGSPGEPIVTDKEQPFQWQARQRPIAELFRRMENLDRYVSVQVPSRSCLGESYESQHLTRVRDRFLRRPDSEKQETEEEEKNDDDDPWNILDLRSPLPAAVLPAFLTGENCQLLPRVRDEVLNPGRAERDTATREQWNEWRDILEWVLLSQGGHNTSPHTDSHGLGTWITVQEGLFGFGWLSRPTAAERAGWMADPRGFCGGRWCYVVLEPGQTVFFNSGTVHFVFRLRREPTLALGGHVLQWTGIEAWLQVVAAQMDNPHITNEDMEWSAIKYVRVVARLVEMRLRHGRVDEMGGEAAVRRLLGLMQAFDETHIKERPQKRSKKKKRR